MSLKRRARGRELGGGENLKVFLYKDKLVNLNAISRALNQSLYVVERSTKPLGLESSQEISDIVIGRTHLPKVFCYLMVDLIKDGGVSQRSEGESRIDHFPVKEFSQPAVILVDGELDNFF